MAWDDIVGTPVDTSEPAVDPQQVLSDMIRQRDPEVGPGKVDTNAVLSRLMRKAAPNTVPPAAAKAQPPADFSQYGKTADQVEPAQDFSQYGDPAPKPAPTDTPSEDEWAGPVAGPVRAAARGLGQGAISGVGEQAKGLGVGQAALDRAHMANFDKIDRGEAIPPAEDAPQYRAYAAMNPFQRQEYRANLAPVTSTKAADTSLYKGGQAVEQFGKETFPMSPTEEQSLPGQVGKMVGGVASVLPGMAVGGAGGEAAALAAGALQMGAQSGGSAFDAAIAKGATEEQAARAAGLNALAGGALGSLPLGAVLAPVRRFGPGLLGAAAMRLEAAARSGVTFATIGEAQEYIAQQIAKDYDPKAHYEFDPKRLIASLLGGGVIGAVTGHAKPVEPETVNVDEFIRRAQAAPGAPPPPEPPPPGTPPPPGSRADIDEFMRRRDAGETWNDKTGQWEPAPQPGSPGSSPGLPKPDTGQPQGAAPSEPAAPPGARARVSDEEVLRRYGYSDEEIADMAPEHRAVALKEALADGASVAGEPVQPAKAEQPKPAEGSEPSRSETTVTINGKTTKTTAEWNPAAAATSAATSFTTAKGSTYEVHDDGTTTRNKAARADLGHEGDSGPKERSARTVYTNDARVFSPPDSAKWRVIDHGDGTMSLATQNADGRWGISPESRNVKVESTPQVGLSPVELWKPGKFNGLTAYAGVHPGNKITQVGGAQGDGTRTDPIELKTAEDVKRAAAAASTDHSHAQGEANNVQRGHAEWQGLPITLETDEGGIRKGLNPETGEKWESKMGSAYGYFKGTEGADGQHVDVHVGPDLVGNTTAYVLDELDRNTGKFRQHKVFVGFKNSRRVQQAYLGSTGKTREQMGGMRMMSADELKDWLAHRDETKEPISDAVRAREGTPAREVAAPESMTPAGGAPTQQELHGEVTHEHVAAVEDTLKAAGVRDEEIKPVDVQRAAEIMAQEGYGPEDALQLAVVRDAVETGGLTQEQVGEIYGPEIAAAVDAQPAPERSVRAEARSPAVGGANAETEAPAVVSGGREGGAARHDETAEGAQGAELRGGEPDTVGAEAANEPGAQPAGAERRPAGGELGPGPAEVAEPERRVGGAEPDRGKAAKPARPSKSVIHSGHLLPFIAGAGGLRPTPELRQMGLDHNSRVVVPGKGPRAILRRDGLTLDELVEKMREAGYIAQAEENQPDRNDLHNQIRDMIDEELRGRTQRPIGEEGPTRHEVDLDEDETAAAIAENRAEIVKALGEESFPEDSALPEDLDAAARLMATDGMDPLDAFERAVMAAERGEGMVTPEDSLYPEVEDGYDAAEQQPAPQGVETAAPKGGDRAKGGEAAVPEAGGGAPDAGARAGQEPTSERTAAGEQAVIPGAERISAAEQAKRGAAKGLKPTVGQKPADEGLFGDEKNQTDLVDMARAKEREKPTVPKAVEAPEGFEVDEVTKVDDARQAQINGGEYTAVARRLKPWSAVRGYGHTPEEAQRDALRRAGAGSKDPEGLIERWPGADDMEVLIVKNHDGKRFNVVLRSTDAQETVGPIIIVHSLVQARAEARKMLHGPGSKIAHVIDPDKRIEEQTDFVRKALQNHANKYEVAASATDGATGKEFYTRLVKLIHARGVPDAKAEADKILAQAGLQYGEAEKAETADVTLARALLAHLKTDKPLTQNVLQDAATAAYGKTMAEGGFDRKAAHDSLELAVNMLIKADPDYRVGYAGWERPVQQIEKLLARLPTQRVRSEEQVSFQQFSTPPHYALAAAYVAHPRDGDVVAEPSAGTGSLVAAAERPGVRFIANELSPRRAALLSELVGKDGMVTEENAEQLDNIWPKDVLPSLVVMNPPFSQTAGRMGDKNVLETGAVHIEQMLKRLAPGGRLVSIVGQGMAMDAPRFRDWWRDIAKKYAVRANIGVAGEVYGKYGTTFGTRLLVIDKTAPGQPTVTAQVSTIPDLMRILEPIRNERELLAAQPDLPEVAPRGEGVGAGSLPAGAQPGVLGPGKPGEGGVAGSGPPGDRGAGGPVAGVEAGERNGVAPGKPERPLAPGAGAEPGKLNAAGELGAAGGGARTEHDLQPPAGGGTGTATSAERLDVEHADPGSQTASELTDSLYEPYTPQRVRIKGAVKHPGPLVESAAMASVSSPVPTYRPALPKDVVIGGKLSLPQIEAVTYAGQAHERMLPAGEKETPKRGGFFIGDGCVAAGTRIYDPLSKRHTAIENLVGKRHHVLSLTSAGFETAVASMTFCKGTADLYRVTLDDGREITVTDEHRFLTPLGWARLESISVGDFLASAEASDTSSSAIRGACDRLEWRRPQDCLDHCSSDQHVYDGQLRLVADTGRGLVPPRDGARAHSHPSSHMDGQDTSPSRSGLYRSADHPARNSSVQAGIHVLASTANLASEEVAQLSPVRRQKHQRSLAEKELHHSVVGEVSRLGFVAGAYGLSLTETAVTSQVCRAHPLSSAPSLRSAARDSRLIAQSHRRQGQLDTGLAERSYGSCAWRIVTRIEFVGRDKFYDMYVPGPQNYVAEGFVNHNTGVGKGREVAGVILDNWQQGRTKAVWVSEKKKLMNDAQRDWAGLGQNPKHIFDVGKVKAGEPIQGTKGIGFITYDTLKGGMSDQAALARGRTVRGQDVSVNGQAGVVKRVEKGNSKKPDQVTVKLANGTEVTVPSHEAQPIGTPAPVKTRVDQLVDWFGKDFDGVIAFDEAHNMGNASNVKGSRGVKEAAQKALAGILLQERLPNARIVYVSATGATEVSNLAYADRLGLWGRGTPFASRDNFVTEVDKGGVAAMELIARDMKQLGLYMARNLSYDGVEYSRLEHKLNKDQREIYDTSAEAWQVVLQNIHAALETTGANQDSRAKSAAMSAFWGGHQRFFNQIITSLQMPSVIKSVEKDLAAGRQAVLQLTNTNEASQERAAAKAETAEDIEDLDITPRDQIIQLVEKSFPTQQYEQYEDENGNVRSRPVLDNDGNPVQNREAVRMKEELIDRLASIRVPQGPLDLILDHFGADNVAEVTGRKRRFILKEDDTGEKRRVEDSRPGSSNQAETDSFQAGKKKVLVFSEAGGTGASYHADNQSTSRGARRAHYLVQAGWRGDKAVQGFGRTHRTNQGSAPIFHLVTTDLDGQKRFISSIARRLGQLGALTKGSRDTGNQGIFTARDNLESREADIALRQFFTELASNKVEGVPLADFEAQTGLKLRDEDGNMKSEFPPITQFLNRLLSLKIDMQNATFQAFSNRLDAVIEARQEAGLMDVGLETVRADKIAKEGEQVVHTDKTSGAETKHVKLSVSNKFVPTPFKFVANNDFRPVKDWVRSPTGKIYAVTEAMHKTEGDTGQIVEQRRLVSPTSASRIIPRSDVDDGIRNGKWSRVPLDQARSMWEDETAKAPEFTTSDMHLITGAILPIWDRLKGNPRVVRLNTDEGERLIGRIVPNSQIGETLKALGADGGMAKVDPQRLAAHLLAGGSTELANGWKIKRSLVAGERRIELVGPTSPSEGEQVKRDGIFTERIDYKTRYFVPTDPAKMAAVLARVTEHRPAINMTGGPGDTTEAARREPSRAPGFYSAVERAVTGTRMEKGRPDQWMGMIKNTPGVKMDEVRWLGLDEWLGKQDGQVTRAQVQDYIRANQIEVQEVSKGGEVPVEMDREHIRLGEEYAGLVRQANQLEMHTPEYIDLMDRMNAITDRQRRIEDFDPEQTKYPEHVIAGGEKYRELLLTLPKKVITPAREEEAFNRDGNPLGVVHHREVTEPTFKSTHWDEPNIITHIRFDDRTVDGKKTLHIAEIQSDWHQKGRKEGYKVERSPEELAALAQEKETLREQQFAMQREDRTYLDRKAHVFDPEYLKVVDRIQAIDELQYQPDAVPDAPFKTTWPELAMKRMIRYAAEHGYDRVTWDTGDTNADRYDLSKHLSNVSLVASNNPRVPYVIMAYDKSGRTVMAQDFTKLEELEKYIGKEVAQRLIDKAGPDFKYGSRNVDLDTPDLKVGGEGMAVFYDKILPATVNKLVKRYGGQVGQTSVETSVRPGSNAMATAFDDMIEQAGSQPINPREPVSVPVHSLDITPQMRGAALGEGLPLFKKGEAPAANLPVVSPAARERVNAAIEAAIKLITGPGATVRFTGNDISMSADARERWGGGEDDTARGVHYPERGLIQIAMTDHDYATLARGQLRHSPFASGIHEAYHYVKRHFATDQERDLLLREAPRFKKLVQEYERMSDAEINGVNPDEIETTAFEIYGADRAAGGNGTGFHISVRRFFERLLAFFRRLRNLLQGYGFKTAEDIWGKTYGGEMKERPDLRPATLDEHGYPRAQIHGADETEAAIVGKSYLTPESVDQELTERGWTKAEEMLTGLYRPMRSYKNDKFPDYTAIVDWGGPYLGGVPDDGTSVRISQAGKDSDLEDSFGGRDQYVGMVEGKDKKVSDLRRLLNKIEGVKNESWEKFRQKRAQELAPNLGVAEDPSEAARRPRPTQRQAASMSIRDRIANVLDNKHTRSLIEAAQDLSHPVHLLQAELEARRDDAFPDSQDFYTRKRLYPGRVGHETNEFNRLHLDPLVKMMKENGISKEEAGDYLYALHVDERNQRLGQLYPDDHQFNRAMNDPSEIGASGRSKEWADQVLETARNGPHAAALAEVADRVKAMNEFTLDRLVKSGLERPETVQDWREQYEHYVPLRGFEDAPEEAPPSYREPGKFNIRGKEIKQAFGRGSKADNPLVNVIDQAYRTIDRAERNHYLKSVYNALKGMDAANSGSVKDIVKFDIAQFKKRIDPNTGLVKTVPDMSYVMSPNTVAVKFGGKVHHMVFADRELAEAVKRMRPEQLAAIFQGILNVQNKMKSLWTHWSPDFMVRHFLARYPIEGTLNSFEQKESGEHSVLKYIGNSVPFLGNASRAIFATNRGAVSARMQRYWDEMRKAGGAMVFRNMRDTDLLHEHLNHVLRTLNSPVGSMKDKYRHTIEAMDAITNALDNSLRLAAYASARDQGKTPQQAALIAREATVDFQLKGKWSNAIGLWFPFGNVATQTGARMTKAVYRSKIMRRVFMGTMLAGFLTGMFNYLVGGNDKNGNPWFEKIPEWDRRLNFIVLNPFERDKDGAPMSYKIPMPYNWAFPLMMGYAMATRSFGKEPLGKTLSTVAKSALEVLTPFGQEENWAAILAPEITHPLIHNYTNEDWAGRPVHSNPSFQKGPNSSTKRKSTWEGWRTVAEGINSATGGSHAKSGYLDWYPEDVQNIFDYPFGAQRRFGQKAYETGASIAAGEAPAPNRTPLEDVFRGTDYPAADRAAQFERNDRVKRPWLH
jgi:predicted RNA methylase